MHIAKNVIALTKMETGKEEVARISERYLSPYSKLARFRRFRPISEPFNSCALLAVIRPFRVEFFSPKLIKLYARNLDLYRFSTLEAQRNNLYLFFGKHSLFDSCFKSAHVSFYPDRLFPHSR